MSKSRLWQTCRVLANRSRLKLFGFILRNPGRTVSVVARASNLTVVAGSEYLRALEGKGFLHLRPRGTWVECWPPRQTDTDNAYSELVRALSKRLKEGKNAIDTVFKLATAFTHPRRVEVYRCLQTQSLSLGELKTATGISGRALLRHLEKLKARGFVTVVGRRPRRYTIKDHHDVFGRALGRLALANW